ncbi:MAG: phosphoglucosamine mutase [Sphingobacteriales bacterium 17-39-43]|uniref:phosphoglucosamine mutase n=1 Tax=Daejeonella sp. TaxID=2805397 RepID=UPI000BC74700|nr:phosphoglucosamine mutase [Daejeonella sp.]OYY01752.1 MAG: phosphoglucosamine mutase [Sphingobacteriia bacterium 35-40-5]OYZ33211.1 MAG: phosphoglucosamine mutase [Sphingobacteriales bacterium 16-39-50]OZA26620.1 MAG: phosphoglucosamine mutase [Sphingobacteriales bacterium 17-39-43]HQT21780.1 phosphoglucosamine mutase [Daejeonella sp.]HQT56511.1 phosphoglucosamine mutase [Daejeonella sp.]
MALIKSISGIRGTIGGLAGNGLTPTDIVKFTSAYGRWVIASTGKNKVVIGRDARISGEMVRNLVVGTLQSIGIDVVDLGLSTTPTVEVAVPDENAGGGIILTASHNPKQWNALKLLNDKGEFISDQEGQLVLSMAEESDFEFAEVNSLGKVSYDDSYLQKHIDKVLALPLVNAEAVRNANFKIAIDCVNSSGGIFVPALLKALGVKTIYELYCEPDGEFPHNPEPLPENLIDLSRMVVAKKADLGIAVDPDVDRLCFVCEDGSMFGEEYTLVAVSDYVLKHTPGNTVSNLSSTRALRDVTEAAGGTYNAAAVGEVNVVNKMKETQAIIGGEGNGGVIYPESHYGRDALVGIALFLTHLATSKQSVSVLRASYPAYYISKNKITLTPEMDIDSLLIEVEKRYENQPHSTIDGLKIEFDKQWVHLRKSNTEPIIRIYSESSSETGAEYLAQKIISDIKEILRLT